MPDLTLVALATLAATAATVLGSIPIILNGSVSTRHLGWAKALAAGLMLGASFVLLQQGLAIQLVGGVGGSVLGITFVTLSHRLTLLPPGDPAVPIDREPGTASQIMVRGILHSSAEGAAIGVAFLVDPLLGFLLAGTMALHNVAEGAAITSALTHDHRRPLPAAGVAILIKSSHIPAAVAAAAWIGSGGKPLALGFASGAMFYLVLVDLLPQAYRETGHTGIALTASTAMSVVLLIDALLLTG